MKPKFKRKTMLIGAAIALLAVLSIGVWEVRLASSRAAREVAQSRADAPAAIPTRRAVHQKYTGDDVQIRQSAAETRAVAKFNDAIFAATGGGLLKLSADGEIRRHFTVLDGLPDSDLTALAVFDGKLYLGTRSAGLSAFDGERFESYTFTDRQAQAVTALLADGGRLLVGTFAGGLIEFDGERFQEIKADDKTIRGVNHLAKIDSRLFVGTFDDGLWLNANDVWRRFDKAAGLPSNRVVGVAEAGGEIFVGTDFGLATVAANEISGAAAGAKIFRQIAALAALSSVARHDNQIVVSRDDGEIFTVNNSTNLQNIAWRKPANFRAARWLDADGALWLVGDGVIKKFAENRLTDFADTRGDLTDNVISALEMGANGELWAGTFRRGIDVFDPEGDRRAHLETEAAREINFLRRDGAHVWAATSAGAIRFDANGRETKFDKTGGLLSNSVVGIAFDGETGEAFFGTARGLSVNSAGGWRGLTRVHNLPNDNVSAVLFDRKKLFVATLGGLAQIENGRVTRRFTDANSNLTPNWTTALCTTADGRVFAGTYGGGVFELTGSGELRSFAPETGKFFVNPNAMWTDGERLYVGTLDGARVLDLHTQKWTRARRVLPAAAVLSVTGDDRHVYFGTTGGLARIDKNFFDGEGE